MFAINVGARTEAVFIKADRVGVLAMIFVAMRHRAHCSITTFNEAVADRGAGDGTVVDITTVLLDIAVVIPIAWRHRGVMYLVGAIPLDWLCLRDIFCLLSIQVERLPVAFKAEIVFLRVRSHGVDNDRQA